MPTTREQVREEWYRTGGNISEMSRRLGVVRSTIRHHLSRLALELPEKPLHGGAVHAGQPTTRALPTSGVLRYILSSAQSNTRVNRAVLSSLELLAGHLHAEIMISRFSYNKMSYGRLSVKPDTLEIGDDMQDVWFDDAITPYVNDEHVQLAPGLVWCGEMNIMPTATSPLSGFETYTGRASGIFPHAKLAMQSIPVQRGEQPRFNFTTGAVTLRNYIQKKAGLKAEYHHCYGALLVEIAPDGEWWCRQLNSTEQGEIYDLDVRACNGKLTTGNRIEAITWGDVHAARLDTRLADLCWGAGGMLDTLEPRVQFLHDVFDMESRNHHDRGNPHRQFQLYTRERDSVEHEISMTSSVISAATRSWCETVVVNSNHDNALDRWLREADYRTDPVNAMFFLQAQLEKYRALATEDDFLTLEWALQRAGTKQDVVFLREDESYVVCPDAHGGIECGMHGHLGPNGSKPSPLGLARMGRRANTAHTHTAGILEGMYIAGTSSYMNLGYNAGPTSWSHSHILVYANGKRAIVTLRGGRWRG